MKLQADRTYSFFTLKIKIAKEGDETIYGKITFVDLAGSERPTRIGLNE